MAKRSRQDNDRVDAMIASVRPISSESLKTPEIVWAQDDIAAAIVRMPQRSAPVKRRQWLRAPRHVLLVGAIIAGLGGSVAVAASLLNAHTGYYPTKHGVPVNMSGPGEAGRRWRFLRRATGCSSSPYRSTSCRCRVPRWTHPQCSWLSWPQQFLSGRSAAP
jgi:hypothetical protein